MRTCKELFVFPTRIKELERMVQVSMEKVYDDARFMHSIRAMKTTLFDDGD